MNDKKKMMLVEKSDPLKYIKESGTSGDRKYLGKLSGIGADYTRPTKNGRRYPKELWVNVENSDEFKEGMATKTIFGEADHPETRLDTSIKEIAIVMTKFNISDMDGVVYTEFDILDTPNGRILKTLLDYGSNIGVSSRGLGEEIYDENGETIIDPDTYEFYGFDAVVMPAVASARPQVIESIDHGKRVSLIESINLEIDNATSSAEVESIRNIVKSVNIPELDSINESVNKKITNLDKSGDNISSKLEIDIKELSRKNIDLESKLSANNIRLEKMKDLLEKVQDNSKKLSKQLQERAVSMVELDESIYNSAKEISDISDKLEKSSRRYSRLKYSNKSLLKDMRESDNRYNNLLDEYNELLDLNSLNESRIKDLDNSVKDYEYQINENFNKVEEINNSLKIKSDEIVRLENINSSLQNKIKERNTFLQSLTEKYMRVKCSSENLNVSLVESKLPDKYTITDIDNIVSKLSTQKKNIDKMPVAFYSRTATMENTNISEEDSRTMSMLTESFKQF